MKAPSGRSAENAFTQAVTHHKAGRLAKALKGYRRVLKRDSNHLDALILGGQAAFQTGHRQDALRWLKRAADKYPDDPRGAYNLGVLHQTLGDSQKALDAFKNAARAGPSFAPAQYNLAITLYELGKMNEAIKYFDRAIAADPNHADAFASKAFILRDQGRVDEAVESYRKAVRIAPDNAKAWVGLGTSLQESGQLDDALSAYRSAIAADRDYPDATSNLCDILVQLEKPKQAISACDAYLVRYPAYAGVLAAKSIALNEAGARDELKALVDLDRFVRPMQQQAPSGFKDIAAFNQALGDHAIHHPTLKPSPSSHTTRMGKQTGAINTGAKGPVAALESLIDRAIDEYMDSVSKIAAHPIVVYRPKQYNLSVWATVLEGEGYQAPHIHPSGWLSGVYYVAVPKIAGDGGNDGWIEFGQPGPEYHFSAEPDLRLVKPEPGMMVMFPSYMFHRTIPFQSDETRISIAFDVVPA